MRAAGRGVAAVILLIVPAWWIGIRPGPEHAGYHRKRRAAKAVPSIRLIETAAEQYEKDRGVHPPGDGPGSTEADSALTQPGPSGKPYLAPIPRQSHFINPIDGVEEVMFLSPGVRNRGRIDIGCSNADGKPMEINN